MKPLRNNVLLAEAEVQTTSAGGIVLTGSVETGAKPGKVLAVGPDTANVQVGDTVYLQWPKALAVSYNGGAAALVSEEFIEAIA